MSFEIDTNKEIGRIQTVLKENQELETELERLRNYLPEVIAELQVMEDKLKGVLPRIRGLQGKITTHSKHIKECIPKRKYSLLEQASSLFRQKRN